MPEKTRKPWVTPEVRKVDLSEEQKRKLFPDFGKPPRAIQESPADENENKDARA